VILFSLRTCELYLPFCAQPISEQDYRRALPANSGQYPPKGDKCTFFGRSTLPGQIDSYPKTRYSG
jgi:hypothetical protein